MRNVDGAGEVVGNAAEWAISSEWKSPDPSGHRPYRGDSPNFSFEIETVASVFRNGTTNSFSSLVASIETNGPARNSGQDDFDTSGSAGPRQHSLGVDHLISGSESLGATIMSVGAPSGNHDPVAQSDQIGATSQLDTLTGASELLESLGESGPGSSVIGYYGQTFMAEGDLSQISLAIDPRDSNGDPTFEFRILVVEIAEGDIRPTTVLFETDLLEISGPDPQVVTVQTGVLDLEPGTTYGIIIDAYSGFDGILGNAGVAAVDQGDPNGQFFYLETPDSGTREEHFDDTWEVFANNALDMALDLDFIDAATTENAPLFIDGADLLANDTDSDGDALTITAVSSTSALGARVLLHADGTITYDPTTSVTLDGLLDGETLADSFTYTISDGQGGVSSATVTLTVSGVNDAPVLVQEVVPQAQFQDQAFSYQIPADLFSDHDGGDVLSYTVTMEDGAPLPSFLTYDPATRTLSFGANGPGSADMGLTLLRVTATEPGGQSSSVLLPLTVLGGVVVEGTDGGDRLIGLTGSGDLIQGFDGNDTVIGQNNGDNFLLGGSGNDTLSGRNRDDVIQGGDGNDRITDGGGNDVIYGGAGNDRLEAYSGTDTLFGGAGDDLLIASSRPGVAGQHVLDGGDGFDTAWLDMRHAVSGAWRVDETGAYGPNGQAFGTLSNIESITAAFTTGDDVVTGEIIQGYYSGQGGYDLLILDFSQRYDGMDVAFVDLTLGSSVNHVVTLQDGTVRQFRVWDFEEFHVTGSAGNDVIRIGNYQAGENTVLGGAGDDLITTSLGDEILEGGSGNDTLAGGAGADEFVFGLGAGDDVILDFELGTDRIGLYDGQAIATVTEIDTTGNGVADGTRVELTDGATIYLQSVLGISDPADLL